MDVRLGGCHCSIATPSDHVSAGTRSPGARFPKYVSMGCCEPENELHPFSLSAGSIRSDSGRALRSKWCILYLHIPGHACSSVMVTLPRTQSNPPAFCTLPPSHLFPPTISGRSRVLDGEIHAHPRILGSRGLGAIGDRKGKKNLGILGTLTLDRGWP